MSEEKEAAEVQECDECHVEVDQLGRDGLCCLCYNFEIDCGLVSDDTCSRGGSAYCDHHCPRNKERKQRHEKQELV